MMEKVFEYFEPQFRPMFQYFRPTPSQGQLGTSRSTAPPRKMTCYTGPNVVYTASKDLTKRIGFGDNVVVYGWPSRGGIMMLQDASPADMDFLDLDRTNPPMLRHESPEAEDDFCQKLVLLGAQWWDSYARYLLLEREMLGIIELDENYEPLPTMRERYWVSVAWPSTGGFVVSEFDTNMWGADDSTERVPRDVARLRLCNSMDEKAQVLQERFEGKVWGKVEDYRGNGFIGCWDQKESGEVGDFQKTWPET
jgi:hypothetical protein